MQTMKNLLYSKIIFLVLPAVMFTFFLMEDYFCNKYIVVEVDIKNWRNFTAQAEANLSVLGRILYLNVAPPHVTKNKTYKILVWKHGKHLEKRHLKHYGKNYIDPFDKCSVRNCNITYEEKNLNDADIVIFSFLLSKGIKEIPNNKRNPNQIWAFLSDECPTQHFITMPSYNISKMNNIFNWSMTYRTFSDIPVPYGRTLLLPQPNNTRMDNIEEWVKSKKQNPKIAVMISHCNTTNKRLEYVKELQKYIDVDVYGKCGTLKCEGHFWSDCKKINDYMFYLAFENSNCREYITEKAYWNAYEKNVIPIIMGAPEEDLAFHLPPHSYINVDNFAEPKDLAQYVLYLTKNLDELKQYFEWKKYFEIQQEHGFFKSKSYHFCRICEALNYNSREHKVYSDMSKWSLKECLPNWLDRNES